MPRPGPPVVSICTVRETPSAFGLLQTGLAAAWRLSAAGAGSGVVLGAAATACTFGAGSAGGVDAGFGQRGSIHSVVNSPLWLPAAVWLSEDPRKCQAPAPAATTAVTEPATIKKGRLRMSTPAPEAYLDHH